MTQSSPDTVHLMPCPFCGKPPILDEHPPTPGEDDSFAVIRCPSCGISKENSFSFNLIRWWNARASDAQAPSTDAALDAIYDALVQAQACIRGETPEDMTDQEAREDTINKVRDAMRTIEDGKVSAQPQTPPTEELTHTRSCGYFDSEIGCTCCLKERIALSTEQTMHRAWRKRAEEAEAALAAVPPAQCSEECGDALGYAQRLATSLWEKHWKDDAPNWKPLPNLIGILTQLDNMTTGLTLSRPHEGTP